MDSETIPDSLGQLVEDRFPADIAAFLHKAGETAGRRGEKAFLVGGAVRDLLLGRNTLDIDIVVEGQAIALADEIASESEGKVVAHRRFGTATLKWDGRSIDFISARAEDYLKPGALPVVRPGSLADDLARRDFTVNTLAVSLASHDFGELLDFHGGMKDLEAKAIRVLHEKSFTDDATRIWRAVRYEQRLGFAIEPITLLLLERDLPMLDTVSGDRVRHELEHVLKEPEPERALLRANHLGLLARINLSLAFNDDMAARFETARRRYGEGLQPGIYLALLLCQLPPAAFDKTEKYLRLTRTESELVRQTAAMQDHVEDLAAPGLSPSRVYEILQPYQPAALMAASLCADTTVAEQVELYLNVLRRVKPALSGEDLKRMGIKEGPAIKAILNYLREARLDGNISTRAEEEAAVRGLMEIGQEG